jgi:hypothetical protein
MSGTVIDVKVELDLEMVCPPMTRYTGINAKHVDFVQQFVVNNHVIYDGWLGVIEEVQTGKQCFAVRGKVVGGKPNLQIHQMHRAYHTLYRKLGQG